METLRDVADLFLRATRENDTIALHVAQLKLKGFLIMAGAVHGPLNSERVRRAFEAMLLGGASDAQGPQ